MSHVTSAVLLVGSSLVGGVVGAFVAVTWLAPDAAKSKPSKEPSSEHATEATEKEATEDDLDTLTTRLRSLERRVALLTYAQKHTSPTREVQTGDGAGGDTAPTKTVDDPVFEAAVRDVMDQVEYERTAERKTRRQQARNEWANRWVTDLKDKLGLSEDQSQRVNAVITEHQEAMRALRRGEGEDKPLLRSEWRERVKTLSDDAHTKLSEILDESQLQTYEALDEDDKLGGRGSWGRFGRRGRDRAGANAPSPGRQE